MLFRSGLREFYGSPAHMARKVEDAQAKSEFLRNRMRTMNREINDVVNRLDKGKSDLQLAIESSFFILIQKTQALVDYPTWYGAFEKAMADPALRNEDGTIDEARAVAMADQAVIAAQSGGQAKDLAQIQRGGPLLKPREDVGRSPADCLGTEADGARKGADLHSGIDGRAAEAGRGLHVRAAQDACADKGSGERRGDVGCHVSFRLVCS